jgi:hypothetical protein
MEDNLNFLPNGRRPVANVRRPQYFSQWKVTTIIWKMEGDNYYLANGRQPQIFGEWKMTSIFSKSKMTQLFWQMENSLNV